MQEEEEKEEETECERFIKRGILCELLLSVLGFSTIFISWLKFSDFHHGPKARG